MNDGGTRAAAAESCHARERSDEQPRHEPTGERDERQVTLRLLASRRRTHGGLQLVEAQ
jgi:hypothetical protein